MNARWLSVAVVMTVLLPLLPASAQELGTAGIEIVPPNPTPDDIVSAKLSGTWGNSCTPRNPRVSRSGQEILIDTSSPGEICAQVISSWALEVPIGQLPAGTYGVTVRHVSSGPGGSRVLGQAVFTVEVGSVGGVTMGLSPMRVVCWNLTTRRIVVIADKAKSRACGEAGLSVRPGDRLRITISGRAD